MTPDSESTERWRREFAELATNEPAAEPCPSPEQLWSAAHGELTRPERSEIIDHTAKCAPCAEDWRLAVSVGEPAEPAEPFVDLREAAPLTRRASRRWLYPLVAAAVALLATGLWIVESPREDPTPIYRADLEPRIESLVSEEAPLPRQDFLLRWKGPEGASYRVKVMTEDLRLLSETEVEATEFRVSAEILEPLAATTVLLWQVEASLPDGTTISSTTFISQLGEGALQNSEKE